MEPLSQKFIEQLAATFKYNFGREMSIDDMEGYLFYLGWKEDDAKIERLIYENRAGREEGAAITVDKNLYEDLTGETAVL
jgi:hypothetical protein